MSEVSKLCENGQGHRGHSQPIVPSLCVLPAEPQYPLRTLVSTYLRVLMLMDNVFSDCRIRVEVINVQPNCLAL